MKWKIEKQYIRVGAVLLAVVLIAIFFNYMLVHNTKFDNFKEVFHNTMFPIVAGIILAYLLNPILHFWEQYVFGPVLDKLFKEENDKAKRNKWGRTLGIVFTILLFLVVVIGGLYLVIPQVYASLEKIVTEAPTYYKHATEWMESLWKDNTEISQYVLMASDKIYTQAIQYLNTDILPNMDKIVAGVTSGIVGGLKALMNLLLALIISIYVMAGKESLISVGKKLIYSIFTREHANSVLSGIRFADGVFGGFINGKIIDSFIIGAICYCFMVFAQLDYPVLISIIIGTTNVIPYFGPFIGAIPSILILLMMSPKQGIIFAIFVIILQQIDGNILGPIILGDRLRLSSMWILFAILVGGGLFGVAGMILGAPCFACIYALVGTFCRERLKKKNLPTEAEDYYGIASIEADGTIVPEQTRLEKDAAKKKEEQERQEQKRQERKQRKEQKKADRQKEDS